MTEQQITVQLDASTPAASLVSEVIASLPVSLRPASGDPQVRVVDGSSPQWPAAARRDAGDGTYVVVLDPRFTAVADIAALDSPTCSRVLLSETWAGNPVLRAARDQWGSDIAAATLVEVSIIEPTEGADKADLLLRAVRVLDAVGLGVSAISTVTGSRKGFTASGRTTTGGLITLFAVHTDAEAPALRVVLGSASASVQIDLPSASTARPGRGRRVTVHSATELPTIWQTAHRSTFQRLPGIVNTAARVTDMSDFVSALSVVGAVGGVVPRESARPVGREAAR